MTKRLGYAYHDFEGNDAFFFQDGNRWVCILTKNGDKLPFEQAVDKEESMATAARLLALPVLQDVNVWRKEEREPTLVDTMTKQSSHPDNMRRRLGGKSGKVNARSMR